MKKFEETDAQIRNLVNKQVVPGVSYGFIDGQSIETNYIGDKSWQPQKECLQGDELYDLASLTKIMGTVPLILKLMDEQKLKLHDPVDKYLPEFKDHRVEIFHLLTHTSGIDGYIPNRDQLNSDELIKALLNLPVTGAFDKKVKYTDTGMILLGLIIEKIYKQPVQKAIEQQILDPWELQDTTFDPVESRCTPTYKVNGQILTGIPNDPKARQLGQHCGSAGMFSNLADTMKFAKIMLTTKYQPLYKNYTNLTPGRSLGWDIKPDETGHILFHTGYTGHFIALDSKSQTAMVVLTNRVHPKEHNQIFLERRETILNSFLEDDK
ncbi:serine hydrolase domain-containing protein [Companilactobacillus ginsenosidimutans]|uniref:Beta-lactamase n=1 Tax=Companilactobacillus ginsenosidimutans TaxID=1007676 RepID=A0A0H4QI96_9LACO|nr:serine hydrolase domain-containing protein [Companilactobacillus ginsenosidimutans]AKP66368.1 beta-lactamase [Companilactobacillus ginsenosidimutans]